MTSPTTNYGWVRPVVGDPGTGYATQNNTCFQEIDTDLAVEHDYASGHEGHHKDVTYNSMTADAVASVCKKGATTVYQFVPCDLGDDGDMDPFVDGTNWNKAKGAAAGTIDWSANFGVPASARAVALTVVMTPAADPSLNTTQAALKLKGKSTTTNWSMLTYLSGATLLTGGASDYVSNSGIVPIDSDGNSYYSITAPYTGGTVTIYLYVTGYFI